MQPVAFRSKAQKHADEFDRRLFVLIQRAQAYLDEPDSRSQYVWQHVLGKLKLSRHVVRSLMHPDDRKATE